MDVVDRGRDVKRTCPKEEGDGAVEALTSIQKLRKLCCNPTVT